MANIKEKISGDKKHSVSDLLTIFSIRKKIELKRHCRSITINQGDLANFILACHVDEMPWQHLPHHREFVPEHLELTDDDLGAFAANGLGKMRPRAQKTANKIAAIFDERRLLSGHLFFTPDQTQWHLFYFDQRDFADRGNHWDGGPHIHLINYLWPGRTAETAWAEFCTGNPQIHGALHIRFQRRTT